VFWVLGGVFRLALGVTVIIVSCPFGQLDCN